MRNKVRVHRIVCLSLCILIATAGSGQDAWRLVPIVPRGPNDPDLIGATVDAIATRGEIESRARVVLYGARKSDLFGFGVWIHRLSEVIPEMELEPYMGPDPGKAGLNPHMIEITLFSLGGKVQFSTQIVVTGSESFPRGVADTHELIINSNFWEYKQIKPFLDKMDAGFDHGIIRVGKGVFSPPVEVKFGDTGIKGKLKTIVDAVRASNGGAIAQ